LTFCGVSVVSFRLAPVRDRVVVNSGDIDPVAGDTVAAIGLTR